MLRIENLAGRQGLNDAIISFLARVPRIVNVPRPVNGQLHFVRPLSRLGVVACAASESDSSQGDTGCRSANFHPLLAADDDQQLCRC